MLPDIGAAELMLIAAVALVVVGPKDLPVMLKKLGQFMGRMRRMANEFRTSFDDMARQSELEDLRREVEAMRTQASAITSFDDIGLRQTMDEINTGLTSGTTPAEVSTPWQEPPETPKEKIAREAAEAAAKPKRKAKPKAAAAAPKKTAAAPKPAAPKPAAKSAAAPKPAAKPAAAKTASKPKAQTQSAEGGPKPKAPRANKASS